MNERKELREFVWNKIQLEERFEAGDMVRVSSKGAEMHPELSGLSGAVKDIDGVNKQVEVKWSDPSVELTRLPYDFVEPCRKRDWK
jgi:hypothetical protein